MTTEISGEGGCAALIQIKLCPVTNIAALLSRRFPITLMSSAVTPDMRPADWVEAPASGTPVALASVPLWEEPR